MMQTGAIESRSLSVVPLIVGGFFTLLGVLLTLDNFDLIESEQLLNFWPVVLLAVGLAKWFDSDSSRIAAIIFVVAGTLLLADNVGLLRFSIFDLWPLILIFIGAAFVARSLGVNPGRRFAEAAREGNVAVLAERRIDVTTADYRGGRATAFMGTLHLDLSRADISNGPAILDVHTMWGAIEIIVPERWEIVGQVTPFMGGFEVKARGASDPSRRLIVRGGALMAGIEVKTARSEA
jgi:predicted membrane protein